MIVEKEDKDEQIHRLNQTIHDIQVESNKVDDRLRRCKDNKKFIDEMLEFKWIEKAPKYTKQKSRIQNKSDSGYDEADEIAENM